MGNIPDQDGDINLLPLMHAAIALQLGEHQQLADQLVESFRLPLDPLKGGGMLRSGRLPGQFKGDLDRRFPDREDLVTVDIADRDGVLPALRAFLGRGR